MQPALGAGVVAGIGEVVGLVGGGHPHAGFGAVVEHDLLGQHEAEIVLEEFAVGLDVDGEPVEVVDAARVDAARRIGLRLVLERRLELGRRLVPFGLVIDLEPVAVRILEHEGLAVAEVAVGPADVEAGALERGGAPLQRLRRARAEGGVAEAGGLGRGELERIALVVVPAAQIDAVALLAALRHAHHVDEEAAALLEFGREHFDMAEMGDVVDRFALHGFATVWPGFNCAQARGRRPGPGCWPAWARFRPASDRRLARAR